MWETVIPFFLNLNRNQTENWSFRFRKNLLRCATCGV